MANFQSSTSGGTVSLAQVGSIIVVEGGADNYVYSSLKINDAASDINLAVDELPVIGTIDLR